MKKFLAILLGALMVLSFAAVSFAEFNVSGDARVRGISLQDYDMDADTDQDDKYWDQRVRFRFEGTNEYGAAVKAQITVAEAAWNGTNETSADDSDIRLDGDDYAYIVAPVGPVTVSAGFQPANWGHKWFSWGSADRLKATTKLNDWTVGAIIQKDYETRDRITGDDNTADNDSYAVLGVGKAGGFDLGAILISAKDSRPEYDATEHCLQEQADVAGAADDVELYLAMEALAACQADYGKDASGSKGSVYFAGAAGPVSLAGEYAFKSGDLYETTNYDGDTADPSGFFVQAGMGAGPVNLALAVAMTMDGYTATKYFTPTLFFGTSQPTAAMEVGQNIVGGAADTTAVIVAANYPVNENLSIGAKLGIVALKGYSIDADADLQEIDVTLDYKLGANTTYKVGYGQLSVDSDDAPYDAMEDSATAMYHSLEISF